MVEPVHNHFAGLPIFFDLHNHMYTRVSPIEDMFKFSELILDVAANCGRNLDVASGIFEPHVFGIHPPRFCADEQMRTQRTARRSRDPGMFIWSRYLATVRRDNFIPSFTRIFT